MRLLAVEVNSNVKDPFEFNKATLQAQKIGATDMTRSQRNSDSKNPALGR